MGKSAKPRALADNEAKAVLRNLRVSPQKLNLVASMILWDGCLKGSCRIAILASSHFKRCSKNT